MSANSNISNVKIVYPPKNRIGSYAILTAIGASIAALAAFVALLLGWAPWIMFMGWVAYFTRPTPSDGLQTYICVVVGLALGAVAVLSAAALAPGLGAAALPIVVFAIACIVIGTRGLPIMNNLLGYFLGLITFFAAHMNPTAASIGALAAAIAIGFAAGILSQRIQSAIAA